MFFFLLFWLVLYMLLLKKINFRQNKTKTCVTELPLRSTQVYHAFQTRGVTHGFLASDIHDWINHAQLPRVLCLCQVVGTHWLRPDFCVLSEIYSLNNSYSYTTRMLKSGEIFWSGITRGYLKNPSTNTWLVCIHVYSHVFQDKFWYSNWNLM